MAEKVSPGHVPAEPSPEATQCRGHLGARVSPALIWAQQDQLCWWLCSATPMGTPLLTPSSSSMISVPMEARVVHLQLLVALTAQRLCALNLQTAWCGAREEQGQSPRDVQLWSPTPPQLAMAASGHHPTPLLLQASLGEGPPTQSQPQPTPQQDPVTDLRRRGHGR